MTDDIKNMDATTDQSDTEQTPVRADDRLAINPNVKRFLFVDVAAQRAKQLRKGALNRLALAAAAGDIPLRDVGQKPERIAMEEVRRGFVQYEIPGVPPTPTQEG